MVNSTRMPDLEIIFDILALEKGVREHISRPDKIVNKELYIQMDDGALRSFVAWRVQYSNALGPYKGGIRFHPSVSEEEVIDLAARMALKCALLGLPLGGAKGGVVCEPSEFSEKELEQISRAYAREFAPMFGPRRDIPAPDVGTDERIMAWMADEYNRYAGQMQLGAFTGKPLIMGGSLGRKEATGRGVVYVTQDILAHIGRSLRGLRVVVQGFGNVGSHAALFFHTEGARVISVSESSGALFQQEGLDIPALIKFKQESTAPITESGMGKSISTDQVLTLPCDILAPAAVENAITDVNAKFIQAPLIVEGANGPTTPEAEDILLKRGARIVPDILANAGGVVVSFFEWQQNQTLSSWSESEVNEKLRHRLSQATQELLRSAQEKHLDLRTAALVLAVQRIAQAIRYITSES